MVLTMVIVGDNGCLWIPTQGLCLSPGDATRRGILRLQVLEIVSGHQVSIFLGTRMDTVGPRTAEVLEESSKESPSCLS